MILSSLVFSVFSKAPSDKTMIVFSKEKKENTRMGKQTASAYAAKIKTKIHSEKFQFGCINDTSVTLVGERKHLNVLIYDI